ncbi:BCCT family transporter [Bengtsoniella intestinalis]|uniref:BCCT family transporter n=1 Tax=Bengtsoniella intestinalis TaxID=3073143 RepID=UPI00391FC3BB
MSNGTKISGGKKTYDLGLILAGVGIQVVLVILMVLSPDGTYNVIQAMFDSAISGFGSIMLVFTFASFGISLYLALGKYGNIKLGDSEPEYSMFSYISMMTLASLASAAIYWSFTEWASYYGGPGLNMEAGSFEALDTSLSYAFFHWGIGMQSLYVPISIAIAYAVYIKKVKFFQISAIFNEMLGDKVSDSKKVIIAKVIEFIVILGIVGGLGSTLGLAVPLAGAGLTQAFGLELTFGVKVGILLAMAVVFTITSFLGTKKGMARISNMSTIICLILLAYLFIMGPSVFIMDNIVSSLGHMTDNFVRMSLFTDPIGGGMFPDWWTIYFIAFYLNYTAFMGIFIAKVSKGRTIKELTLATLLGISAGVWVLFGVNGSFAIDAYMNGTVDVVGLVNEGLGQDAIFQVYALLPGGSVIIPLVVLVMIVGFVASSLDTASLSLAQTTTLQLDENGDPSKFLRIFWCFVLTLLPLAIMFVEADFNIIKMISILTAIPFLFILAFIYVGLFKWLKNHKF